MVNCKHCGQPIGTNPDCVYCEHIYADAQDFYYEGDEDDE